MCTAVTYKTKDFYFGRTLDLDCSYEEQVSITPRNYTFNFRNAKTIENHYAIIGMAYILNNYPLYYDAVNEKGLGIAGLNFVGNAHYNNKSVQNKDNIAQFELIPWLLCQCATVAEAKSFLEKINITDTPFCEKLPPAQLHWLIADKNEAITLEATHDGIRIYQNPVGVLTNNPTFSKQMFSLNNYMNLSAKPPKNLFSAKLPLHEYSKGMGAIGLPGDLSSQSRFVRASFVKMNSVSKNTEDESVNQFFHILSSVEQQRGCCAAENEKFEITIYSSCCNTDKGIYYYTTYDNHQISAVNMHNEDLNGKSLISYELI